MSFLLSGGLPILLENIPSSPAIRAAQCVAYTVRGSQPASQCEAGWALGSIYLIVYLYLEACFFIC